MDLGYYAIVGTQVGMDDLVNPPITQCGHRTSLTAPLSKIWEAIDISTLRDHPQDANKLVIFPEHGTQERLA